jgi:protoheme IX farnesyltransferase
MSQLTSAGVGAVEREASRDRAASPSLLGDLMTLTKMRITLMVALTAFVGFALAATDGPGAWSWLRLAGTLVGTAVSCMGASVLNQVYERDTDGMMERTRQRPLPAGRVNPFVATLLGVLLSVLGVGILLATTHWLAAALSAATILSYVLIYTPLKRTTSLALIIGAAPGAAPPLIGYAAANGTLGAAAWLCFAIMFVWQVPHFLAIAWLYRDDYARTGMPMLPCIDAPDGRRTFRQVLISCLLLLPLGLAPAYVGVSGLIYLVSALICGLAFLGFGIRLFQQRTRAAARNLFIASLVYLPVILTVMLLDTV